MASSEVEKITEPVSLLEVEGVKSYLTPEEEAAVVNLAKSGEMQQLQHSLPEGRNSSSNQEMPEGESFLESSSNGTGQNPPEIEQVIGQADEPVSAKSDQVVHHDSIEEAGLEAGIEDRVSPGVEAGEQISTAEVSLVKNEAAAPETCMENGSVEKGFSSGVAGKEVEAGREKEATKSDLGSLVECEVKPADCEDVKEEGVFLQEKNSLAAEVNETAESAEQAKTTDDKPAEAVSVEAETVERTLHSMPREEANKPIEASAEAEKHNESRELGEPEVTKVVTDSAESEADAEKQAQIHEPDSEQAPTSYNASTSNKEEAFNARKHELETKTNGNQSEAAENEDAEEIVEQEEKVADCDGVIEKAVILEEETSNATEAEIKVSDDKPDEAEHIVETKPLHPVSQTNEAPAETDAPIGSESSTGEPTAVELVTENAEKQDEAPKVHLDEGTSKEEEEVPTREEASDALETDLGTKSNDDGTVQKEEATTNLGVDEASEAPVATATSGEDSSIHIVDKELEVQKDDIFEEPITGDAAAIHVIAEDPVEEVTAEALQTSVERIVEDGSQKEGGSVEHAKDENFPSAETPEGADIVAPVASPEDTTETADESSARIEAAQDHGSSELTVETDDHIESDSSTGEPTAAELITENAEKPEENVQPESSETPKVHHDEGTSKEEDEVPTREEASDALETELGTKSSDDGTVQKEETTPNLGVDEASEAPVTTAASGEDSSIHIVEKELEVQEEEISKEPITGDAAAIDVIAEDPVEEVTAEILQTSAKRIDEDESQKEGGGGSVEHEKDKNIPSAETPEGTDIVAPIASSEDTTETADESSPCIEAARDHGSSESTVQTSVGEEEGRLESEAIGGLPVEAKLEDVPEISNKETPTKVAEVEQLVSTVSLPEAEGNYSTKTDDDDAEVKAEIGKEDDVVDENHAADTIEQSDREVLEQSKTAAEVPLETEKNGEVVVNEAAPVSSHGEAPSGEAETTTEAETSVEEQLEEPVKEDAVEAALETLPMEEKETDNGESRNEGIEDEEVEKKVDLGETVERAIELPQVDSEDAEVVQEGTGEHSMHETEHKPSVEASEDTDIVSTPGASLDKKEEDEGSNKETTVTMEEVAGKELPGAGEMAEEVEQLAIPAPSAAEGDSSSKLVDDADKEKADHAPKEAIEEGRLNERHATDSSIEHLQKGEESEQDDGTINGAAAAATPAEAASVEEKSEKHGSSIEPVGDHADEAKAAETNEGIEMEASEGKDEPAEENADKLVVEQEITTANHEPAKVPEIIPAAGDAKELESTKEDKEEPAEAMPEPVQSEKAVELVFGEEVEAIDGTEQGNLIEEVKESIPSSAESDEAADCVEQAEAAAAIVQPAPALDKETLVEETTAEDEKTVVEGTEKPLMPSMEEVHKEEKEQGSDEVCESRLPAAGILESAAMKEEEEEARGNVESVAAESDEAATTPEEKHVVQSSEIASRKDYNETKAVIENTEEEASMKEVVQTMELGAEASIANKQAEEQKEEKEEKMEEQHQAEPEPPALLVKEESSTETEPEAAEESCSQKEQAKIAEDAAKEEVSVSDHVDREQEASDPSTSLAAGDKVSAVQALREEPEVMQDEPQEEVNAPAADITEETREIQEASAAENMPKQAEEDEVEALDEQVEKQVEKGNDVSGAETTATATEVSDGTAEDKPNQAAEVPAAQHEARELNVTARADPQVEEDDAADNGDSRNEGTEELEVEKKVEQCETVEDDSELAEVVQEGTGEADKKDEAEGSNKEITGTVGGALGLDEVADKELSGTGEMALVDDAGKEKADEVPEEAINEGLLNESHAAGSSIEHLQKDEETEQDDETVNGATAEAASVGEKSEEHIPSIEPVEEHTDKAEAAETDEGIEMEASEGKEVGSVLQEEKAQGTGAGEDNADKLVVGHEIATTNDEPAKVPEIIRAAGDAKELETTMEDKEEPAEAMPVPVQSEKAVKLVLGEEVEAIDSTEQGNLVEEVKESIPSSAESDEAADSNEQAEAVAAIVQAAPALDKETLVKETAAEEEKTMVEGTEKPVASMEEVHEEEKQQGSDEVCESRLPAAAILESAVMQEEEEVRGNVESVAAESDEAAIPEEKHVVQSSEVASREGDYETKAVIENTEEEASMKEVVQTMELGAEASIANKPAEEQKKEEKEEKMEEQHHAEPEPPALLVKEESSNETEPEAVEESCSQKEQAKIAEDAAKEEVSVSDHVDREEEASDPSANIAAGDEVSLVQAALPEEPEVLQDEPQQEVNAPAADITEETREIQEPSAAETMSKQAEEDEVEAEYEPNQADITGAETAATATEVCDGTAEGKPNQAAEVPAAQHEARELNVTTRADPQLKEDDAAVATEETREASRPVEQVSRELQVSELEPEVGKGSHEDDYETKAMIEKTEEEASMKEVVQTMELGAEASIANKPAEEQKKEEIPVEEEKMEEQLKPPALLVKEESSTETEPEAVEESCSQKEHVKNPEDAANEEVSVSDHVDRKQEASDPSTNVAAGDEVSAVQAALPEEPEVLQDEPQEEANTPAADITEEPREIQEAPAPETMSEQAEEDEVEEAADKPNQAETAATATEVSDETAEDKPNQAAEVLAEQHEARELNVTTRADPQVEEDDAAVATEEASRRVEQVSRELRVSEVGKGSHESEESAVTKETENEVSDEVVTKAAASHPESLPVEKPEEEEPEASEASEPIEETLKEAKEMEAEAPLIKEDHIVELDQHKEEKEEEASELVSSFEFPGFTQPKELEQQVITECPTGKEESKATVDISTVIKKESLESASEGSSQDVVAKPKDNAVNGNEQEEPTAEQVIKEKEIVQENKPESEQKAESIPAEEIEPKVSQNEEASHEKESIPSEGDVKIVEEVKAKAEATTVIDKELGTDISQRDLPMKLVEEATSEKQITTEDKPSAATINETINPAKLSLFDMMAKSTRVETKPAAAEPDKAKSDGEKEHHDDEHDNEGEEEHHKNDSGSDGLVIVEASKESEAKLVTTPQQKKSHNILSEVGSKVKHSISKVRKVITGKSSSSHQSKQTSPKQHSPK